jgi:hypothetical protein
VEGAGKELKPGGKAWEERLKNITKLVEGDIRALRPLTNNEQEERELSLANRTLQFYLNGYDPQQHPDKVFNVVRKVLKDGRIRFYAKNQITGNIDEDVTTKIREKTYLPVPGQDVKTLDSDVIDKPIGETPVSQIGVKIPTWIKAGGG